MTEEATTKSKPQSQFQDVVQDDPHSIPPGFNTTYTTLPGDPENPNKNSINSNITPGPLHDSTAPAPEPGAVPTVVKPTVTSESDLPPYMFFEGTSTEPVDKSKDPGHFEIAKDSHKLFNEEDNRFVGSQFVPKPLEPMRKFVYIAMIGFGSANQELARLILKNNERIYDYRMNMTPMEILVTGIFTSTHGGIFCNKGIDLEALLDCPEALENLSRAPGIMDERVNFRVDFQMESYNLKYASCEKIICYIEKLKKCKALDMVVEGIPAEYNNANCDSSDSDPASVIYARYCLSKGIHYITANKIPVALYYDELTYLAYHNKCKFRFESSCGDGVPIFSLGRSCLPGNRIIKFEGILNTTSNYILSLLEDKKVKTIEEGIEQAKRLGITEKDSLKGDIEGYDAVLKCMCLARSLMNRYFVDVLKVTRNKWEEEMIEREEKKKLEEEKKKQEEEKKKIEEEKKSKKLQSSVHDAEDSDGNVVVKVDDDVHVVDVVEDNNSNSNSGSESVGTSVQKGPETIVKNPAAAYYVGDPATTEPLYARPLSEFFARFINPTQTSSSSGANTKSDSKSKTVASESNSLVKPKPKAVAKPLNVQTKVPFDSISKYTKNFIKIPTKIEDVHRDSMLNPPITLEEVQKLKEFNKRIKFICTGEIIYQPNPNSVKQSDLIPEIKLSVKKTIIDSTHPFWNVNRLDNVWRFESDNLCPITIVQHDGTTRDTGYGLFADVLNVAGWQEME